ncbi:MAG TPA: phosphotransferase family protein [Candidatus Corynebacterium avicola]|uniref:Phosphotransferase family protein n=1 Tax=Candidatus Corynebacterium avicola TaxID=2838527 RepID=A0A9D1RR24_9CORY|nr:phosphotransferase family protein [Candidatus Corynebacterium avicola]
MAAAQKKAPELDPAVLTRWLQGEGVEVAGELEISLLGGGRSNLTYAVHDGVHRWVVRRPPQGQVLATAHDMVREFRAISALHGTDVAVPEPIALCEDVELIGVPFYVMGQVEGTVYRSAPQLEEIGPARTRQVALRMVDTLAELHKIDPATVGLDDFGRPQGFNARQVKRWTKQLKGSWHRDLVGADELIDRLSKNPPETQSASIVHGDYRIDNLMFDDEDEVVALFDWELATLADPLNDVALFLVYQNVEKLGSESTGALLGNATTAPGYPTEQELLERYVQSTGSDLHDLDFAVALASFKLAVIIEGIHYRYVQGKAVGEGFAEAGELVEPLIRAGLDRLKTR